MTNSKYQIGALSVCPGGGDGEPDDDKSKK